MLLLAAPAWSKDTQSKKDSEGTGQATTKKGASQSKEKASDSERPGEAMTQGSTSQAKSKASGQDPERTEGTTEKGTSRAKSKGTEKMEPLAGAKVLIKDNGYKGKVGAGDILTISGDYEKLSSGTSITVKDGNGDQATFDARNAKITVTNEGDLRIEVKKAPNVKSGGDLDTTGLKILRAIGVQANNGGHRHPRRHHHRKNNDSNSNVSTNNDTNTDGATDNGNTNDDNANEDTTQDTNNSNTDDTTDNTTTDEITNNTDNTGTNATLCPGGAIAIAGDTVAAAGCGGDTTTDNQNNSNTGTEATTDGQNNGNSGTDTNTDNLSNDNTGTDTGTDNQSDDEIGSFGNVDDQEPIDEPPDDVLDEIDIDGPLPETGGLRETSGLPVAALTPPLGVALVVAVFAIWRFGARRG